MKKMKIALDWDNTYTRNPIFWDRFIDLCLSFAVDVRIVTLRSGSGKPLEYPVNIPVIYTGFAQKRDHCKEIGWMPSIWIDDLPEFIVSQNMLNIKFRDDGTGCEIKINKINEE